MILYILENEYACPVCERSILGLNNLNNHVDRCLSQGKSYILLYIYNITVMLSHDGTVTQNLFANYWL